MERRKMLPIGIEDFETIRKDGYYYADKTGLIAELLKSGGLVTLFTRPRRFGKSLNMSMLEKFFSPESDKSVFEGLRIAEETELCREHMGQYPVINVSLKEINASRYDTAAAMAVLLVRETAKKYEEILLGSGNLTASDREDFNCLLDRKMPESELFKSLKSLSRLLEKHYGRKVVILIDEYDVPLAKAYEQGYYDQMVLLIRNLFENTLKSNSSLKMAVLTGCMRISKESIFTGLNNLRVLGVADERAEEYFGFTDQEVRELLGYYSLLQRYEEIREWYDGYRFGRVNVYCPWDVLNYVDNAWFSENPFPENYWINSSGNAVVRKFIECSRNTGIQDEIEELVNGGEVEKSLRMDLTYPEMYASVDNIWSVLFTTGYLTQRERISGSRFRLRIPNREIRTIYTEQIMELFRENVRRDGATVGRFCTALYEGNAAEAEQIFCRYLRSTISIRDTATKKEKKENFYHGILLGMLAMKDSWAASSNGEAGEGYSDILIETDDPDTGIVIEVKYAEDGNLEAACREALDQIEEKHYVDPLVDEGCEYILKYGIACWKKRCRVELRREVTVIRPV